jgi:hypothetical protein
VAAGSAIGGIGGSVSAVTGGAVPGGSIPGPAAGASAGARGTAHDAANPGSRDIFRRYGEAWRLANAAHINRAQRRVMKV